jgi:hypothetical protein
MVAIDAYSQIASQIIKDQEVIIGPIALEQARKVAGLEIISADDVKIVGNPKDVLAHLVDQYAKLFGRASIEVCREAIRETKLSLQREELPEILR